MTSTKSCPIVLRNGGEIEDSPGVAELFKNANVDGTANGLNWARQASRCGVSCEQVADLMEIQSWHDRVLQRVLKAYNPAMPNKYKDIFNLSLATILGTITGLTLDNLLLGAVVGIALGIVFSLFNKPDQD
ncbi:hypothetical protein IHQ56_07630 [Methylobacillus flagellatus]|uniref:hypothetical protein n=1 Tax=Methylobacillus flagellatus TaxID=405 RepID=UPI002853CDCC|nr:hypothetical protein [Methylobacillus flagellatus]MDR5171683.1 hypothetical protein [Methylobacillus flagellatus]